MIARIRKGNDFHVAWQIKRGGVAENLENVTDIKLERTIYGITTEHTLFTISGDTITAEIPAEVQTHYGQYKLTLSYELVDTGMSDDDRKCKVAIYAFAIVDPLGPADDLLTVDVASDVSIGFKGDKGDDGLSPYEVWLEAGNVGTEDDYFDYLRQPATDAAEAANTAAGLANNAATAANTAAGDANDAAEAANTAAGLANTARTELTTAVNTKLNEADGKIEEMNTTLSTYDGRVSQAESDIDQLAGEVSQKASHGYVSNPKTLKEVEDNASVKVTNLLQNSSFENGAIAPVSKYDGDGVVSTLSLNTINPISGNYDARLEVTTPATTSASLVLRLNGTLNRWVLNHVFYFGMSVKVNSEIPQLSAAYNGAVSRYFSLTLKDGFNSWTVECAGLDNFGFIYLDGSTLWDFNFDNLIAYDLTAIFGEGNEPTKEEFELLLDILGIDYFEGEITIPAQKIMQWQLAMIRQNRNAIIALGGTII